MEDLIKAFMRIEPLGNGYGDGSGNGYGDGSGSGNGYGDGYGDGDGDGDGDGVITMTDYRKGFITKKVASLKSFKGKPVYYIDEIPCIFLSIVGNIAKVEVIRDDYSTVKQYIAKSSNYFAHGETKEQALRDVHNKFFASMSFEERKAEFVKTFKRDKEYPNKDWFTWHGLITGSCESGRSIFVQSKGIDLNGKMTTLEFLNLTKNEYNGDKIAMILDDIKL